MTNTHPSPEPVDPFTGLYAETRVRTPGFIMYGPHCHSCYELFYVESGSCRFLINNHMYDLHERDIILIPPLTLHYTRYPFGSCKRTIIFFRKEDLGTDVPELIPQSLNFFSESLIFQVPEAHREQINSWTAQMITDLKINDSRTPAMMKILLQGFFMLCGRVCSLLHDPPVNIRTTNPQVLLAARFINEHYMQPITTADVAAAAGLSPNYLSRKFREAAGIGLHEYLVFIRLDHAALELVSTDDTITVIALRCGFSDSNYFKDAFRKKYGMTPRSYRKAL